MNRCRILLVPFGAFIELLLLCVCYVMAITGAARQSEKVVDWSRRTLPDFDWYRGRESNINGE